MEELIKIDFKDGKKLVSARELYQGLHIRTRFSLWIEQYIKQGNKYGFEENIDFTSVVTTTVVNNGAKRTLHDYALTTDMAKELSMLTGTEIGRKFRKYFIECERQLQLVSDKNQLLLGLFSDDPEIKKQLNENYEINRESKLSQIEMNETTKQMNEELKSTNKQLQSINDNLQKQLNSINSNIDFIINTIGTNAQISEEQQKENQKLLIELIILLKEKDETGFKTFIEKNIGNGIGIVGLILQAMSML